MEILLNKTSLLNKNLSNHPHLLQLKREKPSDAGKITTEIFQTGFEKHSRYFNSLHTKYMGEKKPKLNKVEELAHYLSTFKFKYIQLPSIPCQAFTHIEKSWAIESEILKV